MAGLVPAIHVFSARVWTLAFCSHSSPAFHFASGKMSGTSLPLCVQGSTVHSSPLLLSLITAVLCGPSVNQNRDTGAAIVWCRSNLSCSRTSRSEFVLLVVSMQSNWPRLSAPPMSGPARATRCAVPVMGAMRRSNHASVRPMAALSASAEAEPEAIIAAIWARSASVRAISVRKAHPKPWQMTTLDGFGEASDHSLSMGDQGAKRARGAASVIEGTTQPMALPAPKAQFQAYFPRPSAGRIENERSSQRAVARLPPVAGDATPLPFEFAEPHISAP